MINIEKNVETALYKSAYQGLRIEFEPLRGKKFHITSLDLVEGSFQIKMTSTSTNNMQIGNMSANDLSMELMNPTDSWGIGKFDDVYFCGATIRPYLLVYDQTQDKMIETPFGVYIIDNQPRALDTIKITAFSNVIRLDTPFKASELPTQMHLDELVAEGLKRARLKHDDSIRIFPNNAFGLVDVAKIKSEQTITWRQVIKWCCECVGVNAISDESGIIKFVFYDKYTPDVLRDEDDLNLTAEDGEILLIDDTPTTDFQLTPALRYADNSSEIAEEDVVITGFQFKIDDELYPESKYVVMDYVLQSENNLVFYALNVRARTKLATDVNAKLAGFTYRPFKCNTLSFPHLQTFDSVVYIKDGKRHHSIITDIVYKLNGDMTLTAKGKNKEQKAWEVLGALTPKQQAIIDSVSRKVDNTREQLSSYENALLLFNEKMLHSMGLYKTVETDANGGMIVYFHDKTTLDKSNAIYMFGASGFAWTTDGWKDGNPVWHYGFTDTGDAIFSEVQAYKISADLIQTGYLRSQNGASWINMDNGTFSFRSVKDAWMDLDTNEMNYSYEDKLKLDESGELGVYGTLRSSQYKNYSVSIGSNDEGKVAAFSVRDSANGFGDIFQVYGVNNGTENGAVWTVPFLTNAQCTNRKGFAIYPNTISMVFDNYGNQSSVTIRKDSDGFDEVFLNNGHSAHMGLYRDSVTVSNYERDWVWFNYWEPYGNYVNSYHFGSGYNHNYSTVVAGAYEFGLPNGERRLFAEWGTNKNQEAGIEIGLSGYPIRLYGSAVYCNGVVVNSDISFKTNIQSININALDKICKIKYYSYDYKVMKETDGEVVQHEGNSTNDVNFLTHVDIGTTVSDAPSEIQSKDGKGIELYSYINLTAKGVQELNEKFEKQSEKILNLESRIEQLEALIAKLSQ